MLEAAFVSLYSNAEVNNYYVRCQFGGNRMSYFLSIAAYKHTFGKTPIFELRKLQKDFPTKISKYIEP